MHICNKGFKAGQWNLEKELLKGQKDTEEKFWWVIGGGDKNGIVAFYVFENLLKNIKNNMYSKAKNIAALTYASIYFESLQFCTMYKDASM